MWLVVLSYLSTSTLPGFSISILHNSLRTLSKMRRFMQGRLCSSYLAGSHHQRHMSPQVFVLDHHHPHHLDHDVDDHHNDLTAKTYVTTSLCAGLSSSPPSSSLSSSWQSSSSISLWSSWLGSYNHHHQYMTAKPYVTTSHWNSPDPHRSQIQADDRLFKRP